MRIAKSSVSFLLVLDVVETLSHRQVFLIVLNSLFIVSQGIVAVCQVPVGPTSVQHALTSTQLLQHGQLLLKIADSFLKHPHVYFGDAHVPMDLGFQTGIPEPLCQAQLGLITLEGCSVVSQGHMHRCQVSQGAALAVLIT